MTSTARSIESLTTARASPDRVLDELLFKGGSQDSDKSRPVDSTAAGLSGPPMLSRRSRPPRLCTRFHSRAIGGIGISIAIGRRRAQSAPILIAPEALGRRGSALAAAAPLFGRLGFLFGLDRLRGSIVTGGFDLFGRWRRGGARSNGGLFVASATAARPDRTSLTQ